MITAMLIMSLMGSSMQISDVGVNFIKRWEGLELTAYKCSAGVTTIGYGHTKTAKIGQVISNFTAEKLLRSDLRDFQKGVDVLVAVDLTQGQYDALVSFSYNVGLGAFKKSTLLRKLNNGDYVGASKEFKRWNRAGGKTLKGLTYRRAAEERLFNS